MDFDVAVIAIGFACEERFDFGLARFFARGFERGFSFADNIGVAFGFAHLDQFDIVVERGFEAKIGIDRIFKTRALAHQVLRLGGVVPEIGVFGLGV